MIDNQHSIILPKCLHCDQPAEWIDEYCQEHWEAECSRTWWEMVMLLGGVSLQATRELQSETIDR